jgi:hypothetical protein
MARSCACDRWLTRAAADMGFRALPALARLLWFDILAAATVATEKGHLRFPCSVSDAVSRLVSRSETDVESDIAALVELGWLDLDADGRGVALPGVQAAAARVEAARHNGLRGGRPRKGDTPESYRERRQGTLMLPIQGGPAETQGTETEPNPESSRTAAKPIAIEAKQAAVREGDDWVSLGREIAETIGLDPAKGHHSALPVKGWMDAGASADLIREVVRTKVAKAASPIRTIAYFRDAVMEALARPAPSLGTGGRTDDERAIEAWQRNGCQGMPMTGAQWRASQQSAA